MSGPAGAALIADLLRRRFHDPQRDEAPLTHDAAALGNLEVVLRLALGMPVELADPVSSDKAELQRAAEFYIRHNFFHGDANHYEVLGLPQDASTKEVRENFRLLMRLIHPDRQHGDSVWPESYAMRVSRAHSVLKRSETRTNYDRELVLEARAKEIARRGAAAFAVSRSLPNPAGHRRRRTRRHLPEWLTASVGGFVRAHPTVSAFSAVITVSALIVGSFGWEARQAVLTRAVDAPLASASPEGAAAPAVAGLQTIDSAARGGATDRASESVALEQPAMLPPATTVSSSATSSRGVSSKDRALALAEASPSRTAIDKPIPGKGARGATDSAAASPPSATKPVRLAKVERTARRADSLTSEALASRPSAVVAQKTLPGELRSSATQMTSAAPTRASAAQRASAAAPVVAPAPTPNPPAVESPPAVRNDAAPQTPTSVALAGPSPVPRALAPAPALPPSEALPPETAEIEALLATFVEAYERGRVDAFAALFDDDAYTNLKRGRAAIRNEYDALFRLSEWRRMQLKQLQWRQAGDKAIAKGEIAVKIGWRDGRQVEERLNVNMELVRQDGHIVIAKLFHQPRD
jgi:ketosteroid isomerase-like protein